MGCLANPNEAIKLSKNLILSFYRVQINFSVSNREDLAEKINLVNSKPNSEK